MPITFTIQEFDFAAQPLLLLVPDEASVQQHFADQHEAGKNPAFPFWAKLWPASVALCQYLEANKDMITDKKVVELAAGLGLPSLLASKYASEVICSDYVPEAIDLVKRSASLNQSNNIGCRLIDWHHYPADIAADVVLLSDINYDPTQFDVLKELLIRLIDKRISIIISTPQRIMGKPFIESLLPFCKEKVTVNVETGKETEEIFIMQLEKQG